MTDKIKIIFVVNAFCLPSGAEYVLREYIKNENRIMPLFLFFGIHKEVIDVFNDLTDNKNLFFIYVQSNILSKQSRLALFGLYKYRLCQIIKKHPKYKEINLHNDIDLIYYNNSFEGMTLIDLFPGKKKILHIHDMIDMFQYSQKKAILSACQKVDSLITVSMACKNMIASNGIPPSKISVAYNSTEEGFTPFVPQTNNEKLVVGFIGSAIKRKGFDFFVKVLNELDKKKTNIGLKKISAIIVTKTSSDSQYFKDCLSALHQEIELNLFQNLEHNRVFPLYKRMTFLFLPSRHDPLPTVFIEASMNGTPVIGTAKDGILEMQKCDKMLFREDDLIDAINSIIYWINEPVENKKKIMFETQDYIRKTFSIKNKKDIIFNALYKTIDGGNE